MAPKKRKKDLKHFLLLDSLTSNTRGLKRLAVFFILAFTLPEMTDKEFLFLLLIHCLMQKLDEQKSKYQQRIIVFFKFTYNINSQAKMTRKLLWVVGRTYVEILVVKAFNNPR